MNPPMVFELLGGAMLVWVEHGQGWVAVRARGSAPGPWLRLADQPLPDVGGRVLPASEVAALTPPTTGVPT